MSPGEREKLRARLLEQLPPAADGRIYYESFANAGGEHLNKLAECNTDVRFWPKADMVAPFTRKEETLSLRDLCWWKETSVWWKNVSIAGWLRFLQAT